MKILVTGGAGFIASHVADHYIALGHEVVILDNLSTGQEANINPKARFIEADITDKDRIREIILEEKPEVINHHAAHIQVGYSVKNPQFDAENNILGLLNIMEAAKELPIKKVIMAATGGAMYGNKATPFTEEMKAEPLSPYGISKRAGELYLNYYHELYKIPFISLRYSNVYGPRQNAHGESGVIAIFAEMLDEGKTPIINGDGSHTRDYVYVEDVARANELALSSDFVGELNIGTKTEISTLEVFQKVVQEMGLQVTEEHGPERPGEQVRSSLDYSKAASILGWEPTVDFNEGVKRTVAWYKNK
jgi:UDP-glucose 4-epimerase